jgi:hypothetical protein
LPENLPMVLIKPPEACSTAEVYKVTNKHFLNLKKNACVLLITLLCCSDSGWNKQVKLIP